MTDQVAVSKNDVQPARPAVVVSDKDELNTSQMENSGVPSTEEPRELSPREEIYKKHDETHRPSTTPEPDDLANGFAEEQNAEASVATPDPDTDPELETVQRQKPGPKPQVEVTVNGVTRKVDKAKVDAAGGVDAYQMMVASQEKLRMISQRQKELDDREAAFKKQQEEFEQRNLAAPAEDPNRARPEDLATPVEDRQSELRRQANEALLDGDLKEAARLNAQADQILVETASNNAIQHVEQTQKQREEEAIRQANIAAAAKRKAELEAGTANFAIEFPEIMNDRNLFNLADAETMKIVEDHPDWTPTQVMQQAGKNVTKWVQEQGLQNQPDSLQQKALEKRAMSTPTGGSGRSPRKPEPQQQTKGGYVAELQRMRGQLPS